MQKISLIMLLFVTTWGYAQFGPQQIISSTTNDAYMSIPFDIDNDGFIDVVTDGGGANNLSWHRNLDGQGNFGPEIPIINSSALYLWIEFIDLDNDGDKDLLYLENNPRNIEWRENLDGLGNFGPAQIILPDVVGSVFSAKTEDVDNDGDLDIFVRIYDPLFDWISWSENLDGMGNFGEEQVLIEGFNFRTYQSSILVDIDNDGLKDILTGTEYLNGAGRLVWFKNLGSATFGPEQEIYHFPGFSSDSTSIGGIGYVDINTDGKIDIVIGSHNDDLGTFYHWFENLDNLGNFGDIQSLPILGVFCDIDDDGDIDILTGNRFVNRIYWVENSDGLGTFNMEHDVTTEVDFIRDINVADFNGDGLLDVVSASLMDNKVAWYENLGELGFENNSFSEFTIYPNPTQSIIYIENHSQVTIHSLQLFDATGRFVLEEKNDFHAINISRLESGLYLINIDNENGSIVKKMIKN